MFEAFDSVEFRQYCNQPDQLPDVVHLSEVLSGVLNVEQKELIIKYLRAISEADGRVSSEEEMLLSQIAGGLGLSLVSSSTKNPNE